MVKQIKFKKIVKYEFKFLINPIENPFLMIGILYLASAIGMSLWNHKFFNPLWIATLVPIIITLIGLFVTREVHWEKIK